jgi:hypothetical protein
MRRATVNNVEEERVKTVSGKNKPDEFMNTS